MDDTYSLALVVLDFIPVFAFWVGGFYLFKLTLFLRGRLCGGVVILGALLVFLGGLLKAVWKLIYTTSQTDIRWMSEAQFVLAAVGFLAILGMVILMARGQPTRKDQPLMAMAAWKMPFLLVMVLSSLIAMGALAYMSIRRNARLAAACFIVAFVSLLAMGGLAGGEQTLAKQWLEESINSIGQIGFAAGSYVLYKNFQDKGGC
jgi:hypothetical protein